MLATVLGRKPELENLCKRLGVHRLELFGSVTTSTFRDEESDLDFLVEFEPYAVGTGYSDRFFELMESLEQLFGHSVDLVVASAIRNPFFRDSVNRTKTLLYAA